MDLRYGHTPKRGAVGTAEKWGGGSLERTKLGKRGGLKDCSCNKRILETDVAQKGVLGSLFN